MMKLPLHRLVIAVTLVAAGASATRTSAHGDRVLVFSKTAGFRHASIPDGIRALAEVGEGHWTIEATEDADVFTDERLANFAAVVFLSTTGDVLDNAQQAAFERYIKGGGAFVGIHAAADTEYDWPWYVRLVGASFRSHPRIQTADVLVADRTHPSTRHLPRVWSRTDEWYDYRVNPRGDVHVLATLDTRSYEGDAMGHDHPIAWCHEFDGGRAWYTGGGHTKECFADPSFRAHLKGGVLWATGEERGDAGATMNGYYDKVVLDERLTDPMELAVASDGRVIVAERGGTVRVWDPVSNGSRVVGLIDVFSSIEDGLLGVTLDPRFDENGAVYLFYSPAGADAIQRLSRWTLGENGLQDETVILEFATDREECCHSGGSLAFAPDGVLVVSTGDNTNPFASDGYAPLDERPGRHAWDAQRSSGNTHDLRGKILRIRPRGEGGYDIPAGNLFPRHGRDGRPEIYAMGCRNPFRIAVDHRGWVYWGDVGPDAAQPSPTRGPAGYDEINQARRPGNFGWPYFTGANLAYHDYDFATSTSGPAFTADAPTNDSPHNTGANDLPPAEPAWIGYPYGPTPTWPQLGEGGRCAMAGPYVPAGVRTEPGALPGYFDDTLFIYEWTRNWIMEVKLDDDGRPRVMNPFATHLAVSRPMDLELGPDGCLYLLEWGPNFSGGNRDAVLSRIEYMPRGERRPGIRALVTPMSGPVPLTLDLRATASAASRTWDIGWDLDGDGHVDLPGETGRHVLRTPGERAITLMATDADTGLATRVTTTVVAGNTAPQIEFLAPPAGGVHAFGDDIEFALDVTDAEDDPIESNRITLDLQLGHDTHAHPLARMAGTRGTVSTRTDDGHEPEADLFTLLAASYTDLGAEGAPPLTARADLILQPLRKQAEHYTRQSGVQLEDTQDPRGGRRAIAFIEDGDWAAYKPLDLRGIDAVSFRVASATNGGFIELRAGSDDGPLAARAAVPPTGGWQRWTDVTAHIEDPGGSHEYFLVFRGDGDGSLFNVNWIDFHGTGVARHVRSPATRTPHVAIVVGDDRGGADEAMETLAVRLERCGIRVTVCHAIDAETGARNPGSRRAIDGLVALEHADLLVLRGRGLQLPADHRVAIVEFVRGTRPVVLLPTDEAALLDEPGVLGDEAWLGVTTVARTAARPVRGARLQHPALRGVDLAGLRTASAANVRDAEGWLSLLEDDDGGIVLTVRDGHDGRDVIAACASAEALDSEPLARSLVQSILWALGRGDTIPAGGVDVTISAP